MSEKRHAHLDAKNTDTYQRTKKAKEEREKWKQKMMQESLSYSSEELKEARKWKQNSSENGLELSLGMRKSCSLESLQTVLQELQKEENIIRTMPNYTAMSSKERRCNDSFRAAVDRSYEAMHKGTMEIVEEDNENIHPDKRLEYDSSQATFDIAHDDMFLPYNNKLNGSKKKKLLKGLGSVFRFGKTRKSDSSKKMTQEELRQEAERLRARWAAQEEHDRIQEHYKRFVEQQKHEEQIKNHMFSTPVPSSTHYSLSPQQRQRIQFLRSRYQQCYDDDERHDWNEQETKEILVRQPSLPMFSSHRRYQIGAHHQSPEIHRAHSQPPMIRRTQSLRYTGRQQVFNTHSPHTISRKIDIYKEMERARSRTGILDPKVYEHYMNYPSSSNNCSPSKNTSPRNFYSPQLNNSKINDPDKMLQEETKHPATKDVLENRSPYKNEKHSNVVLDYTSSRNYYTSHQQTPSKYSSNSPVCSNNNRRQNCVAGSKV
ncbi:partitioning defective 3 homolog isoform X2 [Centruroides sculpturatus]|uniref:partitioning defective 3 homolog isoform X2 n=1 Tax=Centruroides sculpturatus TaxID=218467 RepID=UPI000C6C9AED|nr:partitioning defective 3 homolog isoform X2 [Centruroides sculpturatus]